MVVVMEVVILVEEMTMEAAMAEEILEAGTD